MTFATNARRVGFLLLFAGLAAGAAFGQPCPGGGVNTSLVCDGGDRVSVPGAAPGVFDGFTDFTLEGFVRVNVGSQYSSVVISNEGGNAGGYVLAILSNGSLQIALQGVPAATPPIGLNDGAWHHIAAARIGQTVKLYADGVNVHTAIIADVGTSPNNVLAIGTSSYSPQSGVDGAIDEVRIWNVGRNQSEINSSRLTVLNGNEPGLIGYWRMDDGAGQVVTNSAVATGAVADGVLGTTSAVFTDDPAWSFADSAPLVICTPSTGQANAANASLRVNGVGPMGVQGPFMVTVPTTGPFANQLTMTWEGPPSGTLILLTSAGLAPNSLILPCLGSLDLDIQGLAIFDFSTLPYPLNLLYTLNANGFTQMSFYVPTGSLTGLHMQGAVLNPCPFIPLVLTAAFAVN